MPSGQAVRDFRATSPWMKAAALLVVRMVVNSGIWLCLIDIKCRYPPASSASSVVELLRLP